MAKPIPEMPSSVFVALVGRPNVGKSSLTNYLVGEKVAIVTQKPQTTRSRITGIITKGPVQYVLMDTPGIHAARNKLDARMTQTAAASLKDVDVTLMLFEPEGEFTDAELRMVAALQKGGPAVAVINKVDLLNSLTKLEARRRQIEEFGCFDRVLTVSAKDGTGCDELFAVLKPMFVQWDEFTFWGTACKMVCQQNMLYPGAPGNLAARAYLPGMMLVSYLFQPVHWAEWQCLAAYAFLFLAAFAACASLPKRHWAISFVLLGAAVLLPFFFTVAVPGEASKVYLNAMGDVPLGLCFGGTFCVWLGTGHKKSGLVLTALSLCMLTLIKDMGLAYAMILVGIIFLDLCARQPKYTVKNLARQLIPAALLALPVLACFVGWSKYVSVAASIDKNSVGSAGVSYAGILVGGAKQLLGIGRTETFAKLMQLMAAAFTQRSVGLLGSGVRVLALLVLVNAAAFVCTQKGQRRRVAVTFAAFAAAFAAFYLFHLFLYYYNFAQVEALALKDYDRYIGPYYMGWMLASLYMLGRGAAEGCRPRMGRLAVLAVCGAVAAVFVWRGVPAGAFWNDLSGLYTVRTDVQNRADAVNPALDWNDRVLVISQGDDATRWYYYNYELNATVVHGFGGYCRSAEEPLDQWDAGFMNIVEALNWELYDYQAVCTKPGLVYWLESRECDYILVDAIDEYFVEEFGDMFTEPLPADMGQGALLYRVQGSGDEMHFTLAAPKEGERA